MPDPRSLAEAIAREQAQLDALRRETKASEERLASLRAESVAGEPMAGGAAEGSPPAAPLPPTAQEKVAIFRGLFRGRLDVFPRRWENLRTGKSGWAPACANEWIRGVCEKPRVRCGACPNQAFLPLDDAAILGHLQGHHVLGLYPLLEDDTCWLLAADFDGDAWRDDVSAFAETCRQVDLPAVIERSRSGNGAHVWFFFTAPVPAAVARRMACALLTETMARRDVLSMSSYDRLFPNQDTLPQGGFGNLIALPLQHSARAEGNTLFLGQSLQPLEDPWTFLAEVSRIDPRRVQALGDDATREDRVIAARAISDRQEDDLEPWLHPSLRGTRSRLPVIAGPPEVGGVLAQSLFVEKKELAPSLRAQVRRLAAFQNPEFYKRQKLRLSTALTPRVISCATDLPHHIALPRGCQADLEALLERAGSRLRLDDQREGGAPLDVHFQGELSPVQMEAVGALAPHDTGVLVAPPGIGKTVIGIHQIASRARSTLVLVHRKLLLDQWVAQLGLFLGVPAAEIGRIGGGVRRPTGTLDVAMLQSLLKTDAVDDLVAGYGHVVIDECHHVPAVCFERVLSSVRARFITALTATLARRDGQDPIVTMQCGPVRYCVDPRGPLARRPFEQRLLLRRTAFTGTPEEGGGIQTLYAAIARDEARNSMILDDVISAVAEGRSPIVLTERRDHLEHLAARLRGFCRHLIVLHGGLPTRARAAALSQLATIPQHEERCVVATGRYIGEGFDDARLDTLFLTLPIAWRGTLVQYAGRLQRRHAAKRDVRIYDYVDSEVPVLARMAKKRLRGYRALGYEER